MSDKAWIKATRSWERLPQLIHGIQVGSIRNDAWMTDMDTMRDNRKCVNDRNEDRADPPQDIVRPIKQLHRAPTAETWRTIRSKTFEKVRPMMNRVVRKNELRRGGVVWWSGTEDRSTCSAKWQRHKCSSAHYTQGHKVLTAIIIAFWIIFKSSNGRFFSG